MRDARRKTGPKLCSAGLSGHISLATVLAVAQGAMESMVVAPRLGGARRVQGLKGDARRHRWRGRGGVLTPRRWNEGLTPPTARLELPTHRCAAAGGGRCSAARGGGIAAVRYLPILGGGGSALRAALLRVQPPRRPPSAALPAAPAAAPAHSPLPMYSR
eukprot:1602878-Prymnesium_polylepis.1